MATSKSTQLSTNVWVKLLLLLENALNPKEFQTHPPIPAEAEPSFRKVSLPPAKLHMLFPTHFWVREFWPQIYSL